MCLGLEDSNNSFIPQPPINKEKEVIIEQLLNKPYEITEQKFSQKELSFWLQSGITSEVLKQYKAVSLKEYRSENRECKPFSYVSSEKEPIFGYIGKRFVKIYRPFSKVRFLYGGNIGESYCFGLEQLPAKGDTLLLQGEKKM